MYKHHSKFHNRKARTIEGIEGFLPSAARAEKKRRIGENKRKKKSQGLRTQTKQQGQCPLCQLLFSDDRKFHQHLDRVHHLAKCQQCSQYYWKDDLLGHSHKEPSTKAPEEVDNQKKQVKDRKQKPGAKARLAFLAEVEARERINKARLRAAKIKSQPKD